MVLHAFSRPCTTAPVLGQPENTITPVLKVPLACWRAGVLACWRAGVLACWRAGVLA
ncbi:hypothetical protein M8T88_16680 [Enterobacter hormaechei]|uniref:hypothetical protein n=1 Tax=Enterobacter kobei TaxID=208224 RepID=UPI002074E2F0|nr:hypothetical protein [Enterobacter kobei]MCM7742981.1 hypothetical protein [Enterobacter hormaechei]MCW4703404.1 hypothetical protein [Enterobacter kobei]